MQLPASTASSGAHFQYVTFIQGSAQAWSDAESFTTEQRAVIDEVGRLAAGAAEPLRAHERASQDAETAVTLARARFNVRDVLLDRAVLAVGDAVYNGPAGRNRDHEAYRAVFQEGTPGAVTRTAMREEPELAQRIFERLGRGPDFPERTRVGDNLLAAAERSAAARSAVDEAESRENQAHDLEIEARLGARRAVEQAYGRLRGGFPGQRQFVESFFPRRVRPREDEAGADTGTGPSAPATP